MPYIRPSERAEIDGHVFDLAVVIDTTGDLNYAMSTLIDALFEDTGHQTTWPVNYDSFNSVLGVLEAVKMELYRRVIAPYEDEKKKLNGEVFHNLTSDVVD